RALRSRLTLKSGYKEQYFNMSPNKSFSGRSINLAVSSNGDFLLGASFAKISAKKPEIEIVMRNLTGNQPVHGAFRNGMLRIDTLRCAISTKSRYEAAYMFIRFYDLTEELIRDP
ncbi:hypothetical protein U5801_28645, partial [Lamprobacter modestohalophilus]|uniref:hypothetical protein n=1 Tax=Lamprobacter modestohalophilus TaxID=1064514 RepID=UPI002ADED3E2